MEMSVTDVYVAIDNALARVLTKEDANRRNQRDGVGVDSPYAWKEGGRYYSIIVLKGGSRSSKTYSLMQRFSQELITRPLKITVWRAEKTNCKATVMEDFSEIIAKDDELFCEFSENKTKSRFLSKETGSTIHFEGTDSPAKVHGMKQTWSLFNEATEISEAVFLQIQQRTSEVVFVDYNPSKTFFIERKFDMEELVVIHSTYKDNAFCPVDIVRRLRSYNPYHPDDNHLPKLKRREHPTNATNGTIDEYMHNVYCLGESAEKPGKIFNGWRRISVGDYEDLEYAKVFGLDFGLIVPTALVEIKFDGDNSIYVRQKVFKEMQMMKRELSYVIGNLDTFNLKEDLIVADPNNKDEINKLKACDFDVVKANKRPGSVVSGIKTLMSLNVYVCEDSHDVWDEYMGYTWKITPKGEILEEPVKKDDHSIDAIRYGSVYIKTQ